MKMIALFAAGALAAGSMAATPAAAQRWDDGYRGGPRGGPGWDHGPRGHRDGGWRGGPRGGYGWDGPRGGYGWGGGYRARPHTVCRLQRGYYGPVRRCYRVYR